jgi:hypothetical protein
LKTGRFSQKLKKPPVFSKPAGEFEFFKNFEIKNSKKIERILRFLVKPEFETSKCRRLQNSVKEKPKKRKWPVPYKGQP